MLKIGDRVVLKSSVYGLSLTNPAYGSEFSCEGEVVARISTMRKDPKGRVLDVKVQWENGYGNYYNSDALGKVEEMELTKSDLLIKVKDLEARNAALVDDKRRLDDALEKVMGENKELTSSRLKVMEELESTRHEVGRLKDLNHNLNEENKVLRDKAYPTDKQADDPKVKCSDEDAPKKGGMDMSSLIVSSMMMGGMGGMNMGTNTHMCAPQPNQPAQPVNNFYVPTLEVITEDDDDFEDPTETVVKKAPTKRKRKTPAKLKKPATPKKKATKKTATSKKKADKKDADAKK